MKHLATMKSVLLITAILAMVFIPASSLVQAADFASQLAEQFLKKIPVTEIDTNMTMEQAAKIQEQFVALISKELGETVGYKAGLTNPKVQTIFGVDQPVRGTLLKKMMVQNGAVLPANFGTVPMSEGDLLVRVKDDGINQAKTPEEILKHLDAVIPFIELPDMVCGKGVKFNGPVLVAINVGSRYGVVGDPIPLEATPEWMARLKDFTLQIFDEKGALVSEGKGAALLGDPLSAALWIKNSVNAEGKELKKGYLLSLGSITKMIPAKPGLTLKAKYTGLDPKGPVEVTVSFK
ncbi:MAG: 2-oxopent-4-enoate hydratase [Syntrophorhabdus sp. PtaU1.Bin058]|nr:MAG: 2-oxopent-4-enoate hydratase [Syntrophorhabdus sp. PtaU1.Bin058]